MENAGHPRTAPLVNPLTLKRWTGMASSSVGIVPTTMPIISRGTALLSLSRE